MSEKLNSYTEQNEPSDRITKQMCDDHLIGQISKELKADDEAQKKPLKQIGSLLITLLLFFSMGLFDGSFRGVIILVSVIFIHELGHLITMKLMKYKDVQMFFIPLFGAAVSGKATSPSGTKKAVISLMGPVPGIIIGIVTAVMYIRAGESNPLLAELTRTFLFINVFNLLPFHPLDGGRFFDAILFSRHPVMEVVFKTVTTLMLGGIALLLKSPVLGIFAIMIFFSLKTTHIAAKAAYEYKKKHSHTDVGDMQDIPEECLRDLVPYAKKIVPAAHVTPKLLATHINAIWQRIRNRPSRTSASIGMTCIYLVITLFGIISFFLFTWISFAVENRTKTIITQTYPDGSEHWYEQMMIGSNSQQKIEINQDGFFNGSQTNWHLFTQIIEKTGQWQNGYRNGTFILYDLDGQTNGIIVYTNGIPVSYKVLKDGKLTEQPHEQWESGPKYLQPQTEPQKTDLAFP